MSVLSSVTSRCLAAEAEASEAASLRALTDLVVRTSESLALWSVLNEHQFHVVVGAMSKDQQKTLASMTFKNFVTSGKEVSQSIRNHP